MNKSRRTTSKQAVLLSLEMCIKLWLSRRTTVIRKAAMNETYGGYFIRTIGVTDQGMLIEGNPRNSGDP